MTNKKNKKKQLTLNNCTTVSIITVSQYSRRESLKILSEIIADQDYKNIIEWVIVEGSQTKEDKSSNQSNISELIKNKTFDFEINYIVPPDNTKLGELRNIGNNTCKGEITVCMDDDDYYFPCRVSHVVELLSKSDKLIAGSTKKRMYDYTLDKFYEFGDKFGPNHSTNDHMAWKKEYLTKNKHDSSKSMAEESSFTNNFTNPMVQLDSTKVLIGTIHQGNTFDKRQMCVQASTKMHPNMYEVKDSINNFIPKKYFTRFKELYSIKPKKVEFDICYYTGITSIEWNPSSQSLGGSEQAIVNICNEWVKQGFRVAVYGLIPEQVFQGVHYISAFKFPYSDEHNIVIMWRMSGLRGLEPFNVNAKILAIDFHDNFHTRHFDILDSYHSRIDYFMFKSQYHLETFKKVFKLKIPEDKLKIILNGIRLSDFSINSDLVKREPFRFCYCSCYKRGLYELLSIVWPIIFKFEPRSEFHIYYGMNGVKDEQFKNAIVPLLAQPGVMDHSRQPMELIINEKWKSTFHLYITKTEEEIDCISIRESIASGCIPMISDFGVFKERNGIHFKMTESPTQNDYKNFASQICSIMRNKELISRFRSEIINKEKFEDWETTSKEWNKIINLYVNGN